ncbi:MAG: DUF5711 family protein [Lachnospiraceae bacterium]|nr:DUF5711 family protein [Lachnospiraceae bacterium]
MYSKKEVVETLIQKRNFPPIKKRPIILIGLVLIVVVVLLNNLWQYKDLTEKSSIERGDATETDYLGFQGNLLKYSRDGAFFTKYNGELIWNYTYEMADPQIDVCGNYILIYDRKGTQIAILTNTGFKQSFKTSMPIVDANIASQGTVAVLMQEEDTGYVQLFNDKGEVLASGELHMENNGYPLSLDISQSGEKMVVSQLDLNGGDIKTTIAFYNFGKEGKDKIDNIVANYSFSNQIFPQIEFLENGKVVAFGDKEIVIFEDNAKASISKEIFVDGQIKSVFCNGKYFGIICDVTDDEGKLIHQMNVYSGNGFPRCERKVSGTYSKAEMLSNNEVYLSDGETVSIYTLYGIKKFAYTFDTGIYKIIPGDSAKRYYLVLDNRIADVRIK